MTDQFDVSYRLQHLAPSPDKEIWIQAYKAAVAPFETKIVDGQLFAEMADGTLSMSTFRHALKNFYPLVESFPKLMGLCLAKASSSEQGDQAKNWLIHNIQIERRHANWFKNWAIGFGVDPQNFDHTISPPPMMDALNHFLWRSCTTGDLIEAVSALNYAVEGPTGIWTKRVMKNISMYQVHDNVSVDDKTLKWVRAHAHYDDHHPDEALQIIMSHIASDDDLHRAIKAAQDSMAYYALAADACYELGAEA